MSVAAPDAAKEGGEPRTLAAKVEWLIENMWPPGRLPPKTNDDVVKAVSEATGEELSRSTVWKLRTGKGANPTLKTMQALRAFFGLKSIGYFDDGEEAELAADDAALLVLLRDEKVGRAVLRTFASLSPEGRAAVTDMIDITAKRERQRAEQKASGSKSK